MSTTLTINVTGLAGGTAPGSAIRIDLQNCSNPRVVGTGQIVPQSFFIFPINGIATLTLFDNLQITCGKVNVQGQCGFTSGLYNTSYYSFNFVYQGEVTSIGSYRLLPGTFNLWELNPCFGDDCVCGGDQATLPIISEVPVGALNSVNTTFLLSKAPSLLWLMLNGVFQTEGVDYSLFENVITYFRPPVGALFAIYTFGPFVPQIFSEVPAGTVDGVNTVFTTTQRPNPNGIWLYVNGVYQTIGLDYTLNGQVITFVMAPPEDATIYVDYVTGDTTNPYSQITTETPAGVINGTNNVFTISTVPRFLMLQYNSALLIPGVGYTQSGKTLTLAQAPGVGDALSATLFS